jgi:hypothetical protein
VVRFVEDDERRAPLRAVEPRLVGGLTCIVEFVARLVQPSRAHLVVGKQTVDGLLTAALSLWEDWRSANNRP